MRTIPRSIQVGGRGRLRHLLHAAARRPLGACRWRRSRRADDAARAASGGRRLPERSDPRSRRQPRHRRACCSTSSRSTSASSRRRSSSWPRTPASSAPRASRTRWPRTGSCPAPSGSFTRASRPRGCRSSSSPASCPILVILPGKSTFVGTMYSFGATLSFTVAHAAVVQLRRMKPAEDRAAVQGTAEPPHRRRRLAGVRRSLGGRRHGSSPGSWSSCRIRPTR